MSPIRDLTLRRYMKTATPASAARAACTATAAEPLRSTPPTAGLDIRPVTESPAVTARNHTPIIWPAAFAAASCVVTDGPPGERHSSPTARKEYMPSRHIGPPAGPAAAVARAA